MNMNSVSRLSRVFSCSVLALALVASSATYAMQDDEQEAYIAKRHAVLGIAAVTTTIVVGLYVYDWYWNGGSWLTALAQKLSGTVPGEAKQTVLADNSGQGLQKVLAPLVPSDPVKNDAIVQAKPEVPGIVQAPQSIVPVEQVKPEVQMKPEAPVIFQAPKSTVPVEPGKTEVPVIFQAPQSIVPVESVKTEAPVILQAPQSTILVEPVKLKAPVPAQALVGVSMPIEQTMSVEPVKPEVQPSSVLRTLSRYGRGSGLSSRFGNFGFKGNQFQESPDDDDND